jgi:hypothetical protein
MGSHLSRAGAHDDGHHQRQAQPRAAAAATVERRRLLSLSLRNDLDNRQPQAVAMSSTAHAAPAPAPAPGPALPMEEQPAAPSLPYIPKFIDKTCGNGLFSQRPIQGGDVILRVDQPYVLIPTSEHIHRVCYHCFSIARMEQDVSSLKTCRGCGVVKYCNKECQVASWKRIHSKECALFRGIKCRAPKGSSPTLPTPVRALVQLLLRFQMEAGANKINWSRCCSHRENFQLRKAIWADIELQAMVAIKYCDFLPEFTDLAITMMCAVCLS